MSVRLRQANRLKKSVARPPAPVSSGGTTIQHLADLAGSGAYEEQVRQMAEAEPPPVHAPLPAPLSSEPPPAEPKHEDQQAKTAPVAPPAPDQPRPWYEEYCRWRERTAEDYDFGENEVEPLDDPLGLYDGDDA